LLSWTCRFITYQNNAHQWNPSRAKSIRCASAQLIPQKCILTACFHLYPSGMKNLWHMCTKWHMKQIRLAQKQIWCATIFSYENKSHCKSRAAKKYPTFAGVV
jgi:hypothetical protein